MKEALLSIREYDGTTIPEFWLQTVRETMNELPEVPELKYEFTKRLIAQRIKGKAIEIIERISRPTMSEIAPALITAFGLTNLDYDQLSGERNNTRQGETENTHNYIRRYEDLHIRIQRALDAVPGDYRESLRYMERCTHVEKFIKSLRLEIRLHLLSSKPLTLRETFNKALMVDREIKNDEILRKERISSAHRSVHAHSGHTRHTPQRIPHDQKIPTQTHNLNSKPPFQSSNFTRTAPLTQKERNKKYYSTHCKMHGHSNSYCRELHPELRNATSNFRPRQYLAESPPNDKN